jgi:Type ISP C-terminal specificity domain
MVSKWKSGGPAITCRAYVSDLHHFRGSYGGKEIFPLYRNAEAWEANVLPGLLELPRREYKCDASPEDFLAYLYGILA